MSFVFYDTETTGTETAFDQILQFAAIKTDGELKELDRIETRCRLMPHIVPSPGAMYVTGVTVAQLLDQSNCSHYDMVRQIRAKLSEWSPSIILGYNSLDFDEHLLRQAFYKTLHPPYLTNTNGNGRSDVLRMVRAASIFAPDAITIPVDGKGKSVFKLDRVAPANGFDHSLAHDALADVRATIHVSRILMNKAPSVWSAGMRFSQKAAVVDYITSERIFRWCEFYFGTGYTYLVTPIGTNSENGAEVYVYDLQVAPESLLDLNDAQLLARLARSPKPVRRLKTNLCPFLTSIDQGPAAIKASAISIDELERRADFLDNDESFRQRLIDALEAARAPKQPSSYYEQQIYDGFWPRTDELLMESFHAVPWEKRLAIAESFQDLRLKAIALDLIHSEKPEVLQAAACGERDKLRARRILGSDGEMPWLTIPKAIEEVEAMLAECEEEHREHLQAHCDYLRAWLDRAKQILRNASDAPAL